MSLASRLAVGLFLFPLSALFAGCAGGGGSLSPSGSTSLSPSGSTSLSASGSTSLAQVSAPQDTVMKSTVTSENASAASAFVDSVGVNVHNDYYGTPYGDRPKRIAALVAALGVHHLRDGTSPGQANICTLDQTYAASGVHFDYIVTPAETDAQLSQWQSCSAPAAESYEPYNEYDLSGDPHWVTVLQAADKQVYAFSHGLGLPMAGPSLTSEAAYAAVGAVVADSGNMHDYFAGFNPGTAGWGATGPFGTYGSIAYNIAVARQTTGQVPMWSTETGYGDAPGTNSYVPVVTKMHYEMRILLDQWNAGVPRTFLYELVDQGGSSFGSYGLVDAKTKPKPAFIALAALLKRLSVKNSAPASLNYTLTAGATVDHTLLATRPGSFVLALWNEVQEWDPNTQKPINVPAQPVSLAFPKAPSSISITTFADSGEPVTKTLAPRRNVSLKVNGGVSVVEISL